jgi:plastocyanin
LRVVAVAVLLAASACGGPPGSQAVDGEQVTIHGKDVPLSFEPEEIELEPGTYEIRFANDGQLPHQLALGRDGDARLGDDGDTGTVAGGETRAFDAELEAGRYRFACYVDGHNLAGMVGLLVVR